MLLGGSPSPLLPQTAEDESLSVLCCPSTVQQFNLLRWLEGAPSQAGQKQRGFIPRASLVLQRESHPGPDEILRNRQDIPSWSAASAPGGWMEEGQGSRQS